MCHHSDDMRRILVFLLFPTKICAIKANYLGYYAERRGGADWGGAERGFEGRIETRKATKLKKFERKLTENFDEKTKIKER
jgi:hypothetical protein